VQKMFLKDRIYPFWDLMTSVNKLIQHFLFSRILGMVILNLAPLPCLPVSFMVKPYTSHIFLIKCSP